MRWRSLVSSSSARRSSASRRCRRPRDEAPPHLPVPTEVGGFRVRLDLHGAKPPVWRRIEVPGDLSLPRRRDGSKPRWGGGSGGPIGREVDKDVVQGDKDARPDDADGTAAPATKKPRKNMSIYDNYRMVRPPSSAWDRKAKYEAIGKARGTGFDDIFIISSLFHHISILRVRVPIRLLEVMDGSPELDASKRSWGKVQAWRSAWYDLFDTDQRVAAMQLLWAVMTYQMRKETTEQDVDMAGA